MPQAFGSRAGSAPGGTLSAGSGQISVYAFRGDGLFHISGGGMKNWRLNRLWFWILVAVYFAIKIPVGQAVMANLGKPQSFMNVINDWLVIALAFAVGARLNDAGRSLNLGIGLTFIIGFVLPIVLPLGYIAVFPKPVGATAGKEEFINLFSTMSLVPLALLIALLIWAGTRPGKPALPESAATK
jgi:hypothetical protein